MNIPDSLNVIDRLVETGRPWIDHYGLWVIFLALLGETFLFTGFWMPGKIVLIAAGFLAGGHKLSIEAVLLASWTGAVLGDVLSFGVGRLFGARLLRRKRAAAERVRVSLERDRAFLLLFYHYSPFLRMIVPCVSGSSRYPFIKWFPYDFGGVLLWVAIFIAAGFFAHGATHGQSNIALLLANLLGLVLTVFFVWRLYRGTRQREPDLVADGSDPCAPCTASGSEPPLV